jgi:hypothetical protein
MNVSTRPPLSRRSFLRGAGIVLALPLLDAMLPGLARAARASSPLAPGTRPRRMFAICNNLGLLPGQFFPTGAGYGYQASPYLQMLEPHRRDFTVFSGISHPNVDGGHASDVCFLTGAPHPGGGMFRNSISLDQHIAESIGVLTRFPSLTLGVNTRTRSLSWTSSAVPIPPEDKAAGVFQQLFIQGTAAEVEAQVRKLDTGKSILDTVAEQAKDMQRNLGPHDRERLDQYFTSVRDLEHRLQASRGWEHKPKPVVQVPTPIDPSDPAEYMGKVKVMYDLARLSFETDSTRVITLMLDSVASPVLDIPGMRITDDYHNLSHHGYMETKIAQLKAIDHWHMKLLGQLLADLKASGEGGQSLLDRTMVLYGSNLGDASAHITTNQPTIFAGGGFRHGQHLVFDTAPTSNTPLANLFVTMMQRMGLEEGRFATSTGAMRGLEMT